eukprot:c16334_g1_i1 orf=45-1043(+)
MASLVQIPTTATLVFGRVASFHRAHRSALCRIQRSSCAGGLGRSKLGLIYWRMDSSLRQEESISADCNEAEESSLRKELYPPVEPYTTGNLKVSEIHTLYWEQSGNPSGYPVLFLHGGPGAGTSSSNRSFFDPSFYRIVLLDQRGSGKSTPHACLEENTTWDLVEDIEKLRKHLDIQEWLVFGGSWGSTLSLAYTQSYPEHVTGIILRGIFLTRKKEIDWFYEGGASALFPDAWEDYRDLIPEDERGNFVAAYSKRLKSNDPAVKLAASKAWTNWEMITSYLIPNEESLKRGEDYKFSLDSFPPTPFFWTIFTRFDIFHAGSFREDMMLCAP